MRNSAGNLPTLTHNGSQGKLFPVKGNLCMAMCYALLENNKLPHRQVYLVCLSKYLHLTT